MAGGSQIIINKDGIKIITPAKFEVKAGQHLFKSGATATVALPMLPKSICLDCMKKAAENGSVFIKK
ncbi:hypothetical protein [Acinetobacter sp. RF14B]|uniref:hypothetical protein n=1 Tax=Acinetobacter sp. RF14B TaxID=2650965 RepID=UPI00116DB089|nr:hypothetical protein [Acinetobacter sp. RF14B]TQR64459.1 hypothetical protein E2K52_07010 [Acinetobacter sp. RF14B]